MELQFTYGLDQRFRRRTHDLHFLGRVRNVTYPVAEATYRLNDGAPVDFYVEHVPEPPGIDWTYEYKDSPAFLRLRRRGQFVVEIPTSAPMLEAGSNTLAVRIQDSEGSVIEEQISFEWNPDPPSLPLDLTDLSSYGDIQEVGQVVTGAFDLDTARNCIRSQAPVHPDSLLVLGPLAGSQEATYQVRFTELTGVKWLGPTDFFAGHVPRDPPIGVKPGWSTAGMMALNPRHEARAFLGWGDNSGREEAWVVQTAPPERFVVEADRWYRVRHRVRIGDGLNEVRFRIWPADGDEPGSWLVSEDDSGISTDRPRPEACSFSLFQHSGMPIEWSDIRIDPV